MKKSLLFALVSALASALPALELHYIETNTVGKVEIIQDTTLDADFDAGTARILAVVPRPTGNYTIPSVYAVRVGEYSALLAVTGIGDAALSNARGLTSVTLPDTALTLGDYAFSNCTALSSVTLGNNLRTIGCRPFVNTALRELALPDTLLEMDGNVVAGTLFDLSVTISESSHFVYSDDGVLYNRDLTKLYACPPRAEGSVTIPPSVTNICRDAFFGCFRLSYLNIPESVTTIGEGAFNVGGLWPGLSAPESTAKLQSVFYNSTGAPAAADDIYTGTPESLVSYVPESWGIASGETWKNRVVRNVNDASLPPLEMTDEDNITWSYRIVNGHAEIYNNGAAAIAPKHTPGVLYTTEKDETLISERGLKIPSSINGYTVRAVGDHAFDGCTGLTVIGIPGTVETIGSYAFAHCTALKSIDSDASVPFEVTDGAINLPYGITTLGAHPFDGCKILTVNLPTTVKTIDGNPFAGCEFLTTVTVDAANPKFTVVDGMLCDKRKTAVLGVPANLDATSVSVPSTAVRIGPEAFLGCGGLDSILLSENVATIARAAFADCAALTKMTMPASLTSIESVVFSNCTALASVTYLGKEPSAADDVYAGSPDELVSRAYAEAGWSGTSWKGRALDVLADDPEDDVLSETDSSGVTWRYRVTDGVAEIFAESGTAVSSDKPITALTLPVTLGRYLVKSLGAHALANLRGLTTISVPATYEAIGDGAFSNCTSLAGVTLAEGIATLGKAPFYGTAITTLTLPASVCALDGNPGFGASRLAAFTVAEGNPDFSAADGVLYDRTKTWLLACPALAAEITVPDTVEVLADDAFAGCTHLKKVNALGDEPAAADTIFAETPTDLTTRADAYGCVWLKPDSKTWKGRPFVNTASGQDGVATLTDGSGCTWTYTVDGPNVTLGAYGETPVISSATTGEITIPERLANRPVTQIPDRAFAECGLLTKITISSNVTDIAATAFNGCTSLVEIAVASDNPVYRSKNRCLYSKDGATLIRVPAATRFAATQTQTAVGQKRDYIEVIGTINESTGLISDNTIITRRSYGTTSETCIHTYTPALSVDRLFDSVTSIANYAFTDCGRIPENTSVSGTLVTKKNGTVVATRRGTFVLPFSTDTVALPNTTNVLATAAGFYKGNVCFYKTAIFCSTNIVTDVPLVIPSSVSSLAQNAFKGTYFTSISHEQSTARQNALLRLAGTSDDYGPLTPGVSVALDLADFAGATASGLPAGLKWNKTSGLISGIPTKPGSFTVTFKTTVRENGRNTTVARTATIRVADYPAMTIAVSRANALTDGSDPLDAGEKLSFYVGVSQQFALSVGDDLADAPNTVTAKGLPAGLKLVKTPLKNEKKVVTNYLYAISGTPTKAQMPKTVTLTVSNKYKWSGTFAFDLEILDLPAWVAGAYNGVRYDTSSNAYGAASATCSTLGKLSGKFLVPSDDLKSGKSYAFSAAALTAFDEATQTFLGTASMKIGKETYALPFALGAGEDGAGCLELETSDGSATLVQNIWNRKDLTAPACARGTKVVRDGITYKLAAKGVVTWSGKVEGDNGKPLSVSGSTQLLNGSELLLYIPPRNNLLGGICEIVTLPEL